MADLKPRGTPVETPSLMPRGSEVPVGFETKSEPIKTPLSSGPRGYLKDPELDRRAFEYAAEKNVKSPADWDDLASSRIVYGLDRPAQGLISAMKGEGYNYGKAVDAYYDDFAREKSGFGGKVAEIAGSIAAPGPGGKMSLAKAIGIGGITSAFEGQNDSVEGDNRGLADGAVDFGLGGAFSGLISSLGKGINYLTGDPKEISKAGRDKTITEAVKETRGRVGELPSTKEAAGNEFRDTFKAERDAAYELGRGKIVKATESDLKLDTQASSRLQYYTRTRYSDIRTSAGQQPIPITQDGTPGAWRYQKIIDKLAAKPIESMSLKDIDELRVQARGLRHSGNATDKSAIDDLNATIDNFVDDSIDKGFFTGNAEAKAVYREGRAQIEKVLGLNDNKALKSLLEDSSIPGSSIADELMTLHGNKTQRKASARAIKNLSDVLGEDSESMAKIKAGVLSTLLSDGNPQVVFKNLSTFLPHNQELMGQLFTPEQMSELAKLTASLENVKVPAGSQIDEAIMKRANDLVESAANKIVRQLVSPAGGAGIAAGLAHSPAAGAVTYTGVKALQILASKPVRAAAGAATRATGKALSDGRVSTGIGRNASQDPQVRKAISYHLPDEDIKRRAMINSLEGE